MTLLGLLRALQPQLPALPVPIRINAIAPSWTDTSIVPSVLKSVLGSESVQTPDAVAKSVIYLMTNGHSRGDLVYR